MAMNKKEGHRFKIPGRNPFIPTKFDLLPKLGEEEKADIPMDMNGCLFSPNCHIGFRITSARLADLFEAFSVIY